MPYYCIPLQKVYYQQTSYHTLLERFTYIASTAHANQPAAHPKK